MMFDTDMALIMKTNKALAKCLKDAGTTLPKGIKADSLVTSLCPKYLNLGTPIAAINGNCCAWVDNISLFKSGTFKIGQSNSYCGISLT